MVRVPMNMAVSILFKIYYNAPRQKQQIRYALFYLSHFPKKKNPMSVYPGVGATCFKA